MATRSKKRSATQNNQEPQSAKVDCGYLRITEHAGEKALYMDANLEKDFVFKSIENRDVHFIRLWFSDVLGNSKSFAITPSEVSYALERGMGFDGSSIQGFGEIEGADLLAVPDPSTFQILPWRPSSNAVARMFCNIITPDGKPCVADPRQVLKRMVNKAQEMGFVFNVGSEIEYYYFKDVTCTTPLDEGGYFDLVSSQDAASDLRRDTVLTLEKMGISVEYSHHEKGPSQHEIDLRYSDALSMADGVMTYKQVVKEIAEAHDVYASFMPKPLYDKPGNGMHVHQSLSDFDGVNVFYDDADELHLSKIAKQYLAGILKYAREFSLITNPTVNSYKRLIPGCAPVSAAWAPQNRSTMVRIPGHRPEDKDACRIEVCSPDPSANSYLAFAAMLAAGLKGIEEELELPASSDGMNLFNLSRAQQAELGLELLPENLGQAIEAFSQSELMKETLGEHIFDYLIKTKQAEWDAYQAQVTQWELDTYLHII